ncbi:MAG: carboxypeptidase-like regulatory domain-containing protein, partial [Bryocella sp.]
MKKQIIGITFLLIGMLFAMPAIGQQQAASLTGRIIDSTGAAIPGAQVTVTDPLRGTKVTVVSDSRGDYVIQQLSPSSGYQISVSKAGFKSTVRRDVTLEIAQSAKIDLELSIGDVNESVTVTGAPPQLDTQTSSLGQVITGQTVADLPLNGRSTFRLITLTPGVTFSRSAYGQFGDVPVNTTWDTNFSINGGRSQSNEILIDGAPTSAG